MGKVPAGVNLLSQECPSNCDFAAKGLKIKLFRKNHPESFGCSWNSSLNSIFSFFSEPASRSGDFEELQLESPLESRKCDSSSSRLEGMIGALISSSITWRGGVERRGRFFSSSSFPIPIRFSTSEKKVRFWVKKLIHNIYFWLEKLENPKAAIWVKIFCLFRAARNFL